MALNISGKGLEGKYPIEYRIKKFTHDLEFLLDIFSSLTLIREDMPTLYMNLSTFVSEVLFKYYALKLCHYIMISIKGHC